jgi:hypothetical protein
MRIKDLCRRPASLPTAQLIVHRRVRTKKKERSIQKEKKNKKSRLRMLDLEGGCLGIAECEMQGLSQTISHLIWLWAEAFATLITDQQKDPIQSGTNPCCRYLPQQS